MILRYIMGVDGGNSKTHTVITDETGRKLGEGSAGCGNHQAGVAQAMANIQASTQGALQQSGLRMQDIDFVQYGLAGADRPEDFAILRPALSKLHDQPWDVVCDTMEGLRLGSPDNIGVVLVCGSGTNAAGRNNEGKNVQTGGFGYKYGDGEGVGGHALAVEAFRGAIRAWELRGAPTVLEKTVPDFLGYANVEEMFNDYLDKKGPKIPGELSVVVHQAADAGDQLAVRLLRRAGEELGLAAVSVIKRLGGFGGDEVPIVMVGSVVQRGRNSALLEGVRETLNGRGYDHRLIIPDWAPVYGAVLLGMDHLGIERPDEVLQANFIPSGGFLHYEKK